MTDKKHRIKKFYQSVSVSNRGDGYAILLDDKPVKTRTQKQVLAPTTALAEAIADEWRNQGEHIDPAGAPLTSLLSAAIDSGDEGAQQSIDDVLSYLQSDLLCYRAEEPEGLQARQRESWDPWLNWFKNEFGVELKSTTGIVSIDQPEDVRTTVETAIASQPAYVLFALRMATAITGSAVLALSLWKNAFEPDAIFEASRVDERFQEEKWGIDAEAKAREDIMRNELMQVATFLRLAAQ